MLLEGYLADLEAGRPADPAQLIAAHPHLAQALRACLEVIRPPFQAPGETPRRRTASQAFALGRGRRAVGKSTKKSREPGRLRSESRKSFRPSCRLKLRASRRRHGQRRSAQLYITVRGGDRRNETETRPPVRSLERTKPNFSGVCVRLVPAPVFKTGEGSRERLLVGSIPMRSRHFFPSRFKSIGKSKR